MSLLPRCSAASLASAPSVPTACASRPACWMMRAVLGVALPLAVLGLSTPTALGQVSYTWAAPGGVPNIGAYEVNTNWSPNGVPGVNDTAQTNGFPAPRETPYYITLTSNRLITTLNVNNAYSNFVHGSASADGSNPVNVTYTVSNALNLTAGNYHLYRGTLAGDADGASITGGGHLILYNNSDNRIHNMSIAAGTLDFSAPGAQVAFTGSTTLANTTSLTLDNNNRLGFQQTTTLSNTLTFDLSGSSILSVEGTNTLTFGSNVTINSTANSRLGSGLFVSGTGAMVNQGTINKSTGGTLTINPTGGFSNQGTLKIDGGNVSVGSNLTFGSSSTFNLTLNGSTIGTQADPNDSNLIVTTSSPVTITNGQLDLGNANLVVSTTFTLDSNKDYRFFIVNNQTNNSILGTFNGLPNTSSITIGGRTFYIGYFANFATQDVIGGNDVVLSTTPVPEPLHVLGLAAVGLGTVGWLRRRKPQPANSLAV